jgi:hypothetical protein
LQKNNEHWETLRRSKSYIAESYFSPVLRDGNLKEMFETKESIWRSDPESEEFCEWRDALIDIVPKLNFDAVIDLALYLGLDA